jgi:hypothetical protein
MTNPYAPDEGVPDPTPVGPASVTQPRKSGFQLSEIKKTIITALGMIVTIGGFAAPYLTNLSPEVGNTVGAVVGVATVLLGYLVPNTTESPARALTQSARLSPAH